MWVVVGTAAIARLGYAWDVRNFPLVRQPILDGAVYDRWALAIARGDWWSRGEGGFVLGPLYAYVVGIFYAIFGHALHVVSAVQYLLGVATVGLTYVVVKRLDGEWTALAAAGCWGLYGFSWVMESSVLSGVWIVALNVGAVWCALHSGTEGQEGSKGLAMGAGACLGASALMRPNVLIFLPVLMWWMWNASGDRHHRTLRHAIWVVVGLGLALAPAVVRNLVVTGKPALFVESGGMNFYIGNHRHANGFYAAAPFDPGVPVAQVEAYRRRAEALVRRSLTRSEASRFWWQAAFRDIVDSPWRWVALMLKKGAMVWNREEVPMNVSDDLFRASSGWLRSVGWVGAWLFIPLAAVGCFGAPLTGGWRLIAGYVAAYWVGLALFFVSAEYRYPAMWGVALLAGRGAVHIWEMLMAWFLSAGPIAGHPPSPHRRYAPAGGDRGTRPLRNDRRAGMVFCCGLIISWLPTGVSSSTRMGQEYVKVGFAHMALGEVKEGIAAFERGLRHDPSNGLLHLNLAVAYERERGDHESALRHYFAALETTSLSPEERRRAWMEAGKLQVKWGRLAQARDTFRRLVSERPDDAAGWQYLGNVEYLLGNAMAARVAWQQSLRLAPDNPALRGNLKALRGGGIHE